MDSRRLGSSAIARASEASQQIAETSMCVMFRSPHGENVSVASVSFMFAWRVQVHRSPVRANITLAHMWRPEGTDGCLSSRLLAFCEAAYS